MLFIIFQNQDINFLRRRRANDDQG